MTDPDAFQPVESPEFQRLRRVCYIISTMASIVFFAAVLAYGRYGGAFVDGLDDQLGQVVAQRATSLYDSGDAEAAVEMYRKALKGRFRSGEQKMSVCLSLADTLYGLERWVDAAQAYESALLLKKDQLRPYPRLCRAYNQAGEKAKMLDAAQRWKAAAQNRSETDAKAAQAIIDKAAKAK